MEEEEEEEEEDDGLLPVKAEPPAGPLTRAQLEALGVPFTPTAAELAGGVPFTPGGGAAVDEPPEGDAPPCQYDAYGGYPGPVAPGLQPGPWRSGIAPGPPGP